MLIWEAALFHLGIAIVGVLITWLVQLRASNAGIVDVYILGSAGVVYAIVGDGDYDDYVRRTSAFAPFPPRRV